MPQSFPLCHRRNRIGHSGFDLLFQLPRGCFVGDHRFFPVNLGQFGLESRFLFRPGFPPPIAALGPGLLPAGEKGTSNCPVLFLFEIFNLLLPVTDEAYGHRLDPTGGKPPFYLAPE